MWPSVTLMKVEFYKISHMMKEKRRERRELVDEIVDKIKTIQLNQGLVGDVYGRPKFITLFIVRCATRKTL